MNHLRCILVANFFFFLLTPLPFIIFKKNVIYVVSIVMDLLDLGH